MSLKSLQKWWKKSDKTLILGSLLLLSIPIAFLLQAPGISFEVHMLQVGVQVRYEDGTIDTIASSSDYGNLMLVPLGWTAPGGQKVTHYRFIATVDIEGSNLPSSTRYGVEATVVMGKTCWDPHIYGPIADYGDKTVERLNMAWETTGAGAILRHMYLIASYDFDDIGDFDDSNIHNADNSWWTWFEEVPPISETGQYVRFTSDWTVTAEVNGGPSDTATEQAYIQFTYEADAPPGTLSVSISIGTPALSLLGPVEVPGGNGVLTIDWLYILLTLAGVGLIGISLYKKYK